MMTPAAQAHVKMEAKLALDSADTHTVTGVAIQRVRRKGKPVRFRVTADAQTIVNNCGMHRALVDFAYALDMGEPNG
jgi:hypothetical protein